MRRNTISSASCLVLPSYIATWGSEVNILREWRVVKFFPLYLFWACFEMLAFLSLLGPPGAGGGGCPLAFWSCIKEEMGEKKRYWFCVLSDSNTEDRKTHKESGVGSRAAPSLVCEPEGDGGWGGWGRGTNASLPRVMCLVLLLASFFLAFLLLLVK